MFVDALFSKVVSDVWHIKTVNSMRDNDCAMVDIGNFKYAGVYSFR